MSVNEVKVGGQLYSIVFCDSVNDIDKNVDGEVLFDKQQIKLSKNMHPEYTKKVLLHEIMHIIFDFLCLDQDEVMIERLTNALFQLLKDNPLLLVIKGDENGL